MRPSKASLANPDFPHDRLEPGNRARQGKEDRAVQEKNLREGDGGALPLRRRPPVVEGAVSRSRFQAEVTLDQIRAAKRKRPLSIDLLNPEKVKT